MRKPSKDEELKAWHDLAWKMNLYRCVTMNQEGVVDCLKRVDAWVNAHADGNGERSEKDVQQNVAHAFWKHIAQSTPPVLVEKAPRKPREKK